MVFRIFKGWVAWALALEVGPGQAVVLGGQILETQGRDPPVGGLRVGAHNGCCLPTGRGIFQGCPC